MVPRVAPAILTDRRLRAAYAEGAGIHRIVPAGVARPQTLDELIAVMARARDLGLPLVPRGAGTGMSGGNVGQGVVVDLTRLEGGEVRVDPETLSARCAAGARCAELDRAAADHGLRLPPTPSSARWATLGGMIGTNAAGARSFRYGSIRAWVQGLTLVTADGEVLRLERGRSADERVAAVARFTTEAAPLLRAQEALVRQRFPATRKNTAGYALNCWLASGDLLDLVVGAEGTLGIVTGVELRLDRIPAARVVLRVAVGDDARLAEVLHLLKQSGASAIELLDRTFLVFAADALSPRDLALARSGTALLLVEYEAGSEQVAEWRDRWCRRLGALAAGIEQGSDAAEAERLWAVRHAASTRLAALEGGIRSLQVIEDGCVPPDRFAEYLRAVRRIAERHGLTAVLFGHAGDGHLHVNLLVDPSQPHWERVVRTVFDAVTDVQLALGGTPAGEHGTGRLRAQVLERLYGSEVMGLFRAVKAAFDPTGLLNPGVILEAPAPRRDDRRNGDGLGPLKLGVTAEPLPEEIAQALREIERRGAWDTDRFLLAGLS
jgi:FAD/FMN-containing dehydrogenase